ncbi:MAG: hypothetical protein MSA72_13335 [Lachnospiraceae bacterium]|nr:hypothetical protein [Lachnospiraceae bacterium]
MANKAVADASSLNVRKGFERSGTKYVGYILDDYIYQEWTESRYSDLEQH